MLSQKVPAAPRFDASHVAQWQDEGFVIIPDFFTADEVKPIYDEYVRLYGTHGDGESPGVALNFAGPDKTAGFARAQFKNIDTLPYDASIEMNLMSLHPALIEFSRQLLRVDAVRLYQSHTWAKYTGEADYDQPHHCDFRNHTLTVPSDDVSRRTVDFLIYYTDVTNAHGALHYVTKPDSDAVLRAGAIWAQPEDQPALKAVERSAAGRAGTLVAHSIDTFHRGTNLTEKDGYRFTMTVGYKAAQNDNIAYTAWRDNAPELWQKIFHNASIEQLACLGVPLPGDSFWTQRTLKLTQARWPELDMREYFAQAGVSA